MKIRSHYIKALIAKGENQNLDFKFEISDARKIARTLSAFANTDGGKLLIGVKDNGVITGVRTDEEEYMIESAAHLYCKPKVDYTIRKWNVDGRWVLEAIISKSKKRPHYAKDEKGKWIAFVRVADQNFQANRIILKVWNNSHNYKGTFLKYGREEKVLVTYLEKNPFITLSKFTRIAHTTRHSAETILIKMISLNIIDVQVTEEGALYMLRPENSHVENKKTS
ncbi:MAG: ATP-binding protein, partial [Bacteroidales bacterium]|nr:ATP-binding protein [Bacteroidales bacterium]MBN2762084.1 ATP-binding protein [Bacteroidales bacterium]